MFSLQTMRRKMLGCLLIAICIGCVGALALLADAVWPEASGEITDSKGEFVIDISHTDKGYFMAKREACSKGLKLRVTKGDSTYTYDLNNDGEYEVFPLQMGSGTYKCSLYLNVSGNKYSKEAELKFTVDMDDSDAAYLCPSQYVNYKQDSLAVLASEEICEGLKTDQEKYEAIIKYVRENFVYDYKRAASNPGAYLGDVDGCFETKTGLCQDLSAMTAAMLRVQGIPTQMVIGYADRQYHAWINVQLDDEYHRMDVTAEVTGVPASVYTPERRY
ncbi:MAG: transglutaminase domain-containing protein [Clostridia bacterium]|nr:transglutaminase domain-containing protein [Clostridia bacterium]